MHPTLPLYRTRAPAVRRPFVLLFLPLLLVLVAASPLDAQSWRVQGAWVAGHAGGAVVGAEWREPLGPEPELPLPGRPEEGPIEVGTRNWLFTGMGGLGINFAPPAEGHDVRPLLYGHAGVLYRTESSILSRVGAVGLFYVPAGAVGPAALVETAGVIHLQVGALHTDRGWMGHGALAVSLRFLCDILCGAGA